MHNKSYLLVPSCNKGNGTGHLRRMIELYRGLKESSSVSIFINTEQLPEIHKKLLDESVDEDDIYKIALPFNETWDFIVVDYRNTPNKLFSYLSLKGFLIGIDEGNSRAYFNYLIDIIPALKSSVKANISSPGLMDLPERREYSSAPVYNKILISFGGEDPMGLTKTLMEFIYNYNYFPESEISIISNKTVPGKFPDSFKFPGKQKNLKLIIKDYDLIFTSFGLTAFEALAAGVPFLLLNPGSYHKKLSDNCGFFEFGVRKIDKNKFDYLMKKRLDYKKLQDKYIPLKYLSLKDFILSIEINEPKCPLCGHNCVVSDISHRFNTRNFYNCPECQMTFQNSFLPVEDSYKEKYFFEDYKKQYGRTYLEDFNNIQKHSSIRLEIIDKIRSGCKDKNPLLLDIGCAYGPFLAESAKLGYLPSGVEIISEAAEYIRKKFGFQVITGSFEDALFDKSFDVLTMWYVIEHFFNPDKILSKVNDLLKPGGVFAFSTPNSSGISGRKKINMFLNNSPSDHITIWNPKISRKILKRYGFKVKYIRITGHHPERFTKSSWIKTKIGYNILFFISRIFRLGDTFEVYAVKIKGIDG